MPLSALDKDGRYVPHDFGTGFYAGTKVMSAVELLARLKQRSRADIVTLTFEEDKFRNCRICKFDQDTLADWTLFVTYNRGYFYRQLLLPDHGSASEILPAEQYPYTTGYLEALNRNDIIIGPIADDRMILALDRFLTGEIGIKRLTKCLLEGDLGTQYVFKTEPACQILNRYGNVRITPFSKFLLRNDLSVSRIKKNIAAKNRTMRINVAANISGYHGIGDDTDLKLKALLERKEAELNPGYRQRVYCPDTDKEDFQRDIFE